jgi:chemotaxis protein MotB
LSGYSNWELSVDRANAARKIMQSSGLQQKQVSQVRGFADQRPRGQNSPDDPANRRISLIVQYLDKANPENAGNDSEVEKLEKAGTEKK